MAEARRCGHRPTRERRQTDVIKEQIYVEGCPLSGAFPCWQSLPYLLHFPSGSTVQTEATMPTRNVNLTDELDSFVLEN